MRIHESFSSRSACAPAHRRRAFTLIELLTVMSIIIVLASLLFVAISAARALASRAGDVSMLRQMTFGYSSYASDHQQHLLPGYVNQTIQQALGLVTIAPDGATIPANAAASYVWRLAPYLDGRWQNFHSADDEGTLARLEGLYATGDYLEISFRPSFGLNSIFLGGDSDHGGAAVTAQSPWESNGAPNANGTIAATRMSQIKSPASLVLFAPTRRAASAGVPEPDRGWFELRAPVLQQQQWLLTNEGVVGATTINGPAGIPAMRSSDTTVPVAFVDGSATTESVEKLVADMKRWAPLADTALWVVP